MQLHRVGRDTLHQKVVGIHQWAGLGPFHELYTAGLWREIAPQDAYKSPVDIELAARGARESTPRAGYNATFLYPVDGLSGLAGKLAESCEILGGP